MERHPIPLDCCRCCRCARRSLRRLGALWGLAHREIIGAVRRCASSLVFKFCFKLLCFALLVLRCVWCDANRRAVTESCHGWCMRRLPRVVDLRLPTWLRPFLAGRVEGCLVVRVFVLGPLGGSWCVVWCGAAGGICFGVRGGPGLNKC